jgi:GT2 family glycosyltransferase
VTDPDRLCATTSGGGTPEVLAAVGVVIAAYQAERWLPMTLRSLQQQTLTDWVCIIVDDGSTDTTGDIADTAARTDPRITVIHQSNHGVTSSRNAGIAALPDVEHVAFLDSDDLYLPTTLHTLVTALAARPDAVGAYGLAEYIDATGARIDPGKHPAVQRTRRRYDGGRWRGHLTDVAPTDDLTLAELVVANPFWPPATGLVRHSALRATGPFDQTYQVQEDWQLWLRLATHGPLLALDTPTAEYRRHDTNLTGAWLVNYQQQDRVRHELGVAAGVPAAHRAAVVGAWRRILREGARSELGELARCLSARDLVGVRAAAVRSGYAAVNAVRPNGPAASVRGARWRPRAAPAPPARTDPA